MRTLTTNFRAKASGDQNAPIELYDVFLDTGTLHLVKYDINVTFFDLDGNSQTYIAFPIQREPAEKTSDMSIGGVTIRLANIDRSMSAYIADNDFRGKRVVIRKIFADLLDTSGDSAVIFDGIMDSPVVSEEALEFNAVDRLSLNKEVPRQRYMLLCNHKFGNSECFYLRSSGEMYNTIQGSITADSTAVTIYSSALSSGDDFYIDGEIVFTSGQNANKRRKIIANTQSDTSIDMDYPLPYTPVIGDTFTVRRHCDKTWFRCSGDFANDDNFLGFPTVPQEMVIR